jgi:flagellar basal-body rod protein FlgC
MFGTLDISTSGLVAQRTRLETIAANIANSTTISDENGNNVPFRRRLALLAPGDPTSGEAGGVHVQRIVQDQSPFNLRYEPDSPFADEQGYVKYPNIEPMIEQINALEASRAYEANISVAEGTKRIMQASLQLLS